jgi:hypothetical protein
MRLADIDRFACEVHLRRMRALLVLGAILAVGVAAVLYFTDAQPVALSSSELCDRNYPIGTKPHEDCRMAAYISGGLMERDIAARKH